MSISQINGFSVYLQLEQELNETILTDQTKQMCGKLSKFHEENYAMEMERHRFKVVAAKVALLFSIIAAISLVTLAFTTTMASISVLSSMILSAVAMAFVSSYFITKKVSSQTLIHKDRFERSKEMKFAQVMQFHKLPISQDYENTLFSIYKKWQDITLYAKLYEKNKDLNYNTQIDGFLIEMKSEIEKVKADTKN